MQLSPDLGQDPRVTNASWLKTMATVSSSEDTKAFVIGVEVDYGPEEANKAVGQFEYLGRSISASSTVTFGYNVTGTGSVSAPSASNTFTSAYSSYDVPSDGTIYRTFQPWWGLAHTTGTANTPNCLNILVYSAQQFEGKELYVFECDPRTLVSASSNGTDDFWGCMDDITTMLNAALVISLKYSNINNNTAVPVVLEDWNFGRASILTQGLGSTQKPDDFDNVRLMTTFRRVLGKSTA
jgi:hypothetical protein